MFRIAIGSAVITCILVISGRVVLQFWINVNFQKPRDLEESKLLRFEGTECLCGEADQGSRCGFAWIHHRGWGRGQSHLECPQPQHTMHKSVKSRWGWQVLCRCKKETLTSVVYRSMVLLFAVKMLSLPAHLITAHLLIESCRYTPVWKFVKGKMQLYFLHPSC